VHWLAAPQVGGRGAWSDVLKVVRRHACRIGVALRSGDGRQKRNCSSRYQMASITVLIGPCCSFRVGGIRNAKLTYSCEFSQEGLGIELPGVGKPDPGGGASAASAAMFPEAGMGGNLYKLYSL